jgi:hypothetical protein
MTIPARTKALPGMAVNGTFSPSIRYAKAPANNGIRSEIVAVTNGGNHFDAKANAKLGIAVHKTLRATSDSKLLRCKVAAGIAAGMTGTSPISNALPKIKVMKVTLEGSGAGPFSAICR